MVGDMLTACVIRGLYCIRSIGALLAKSNYYLRKEVVVEQEDAREGPQRQRKVPGCVAPVYEVEAERSLSAPANSTSIAAA